MEYIIKQEAEIQAVTVEARGVINTNVAEEMVLATGVELTKTGFQKCFVDLTNTDLDSNQLMTDMSMFVEIYTKQALINL
jgi:hypothetical protein